MAGLDGIYVSLTPPTTRAPLAVLIKLEPNLAKDVLRAPQIHWKFNAAFSSMCNLPSKASAIPGIYMQYSYFLVFCQRWPIFEIYLISYHRPVLSRGETIDSCCSEDADPVTVLEVCYHDHDPDHDDKLWNWKPHDQTSLNFNPLVKDKKTLKPGSM